MPILMQSEVGVCFYVRRMSTLRGGADFVKEGTAR